MLETSHALERGTIGCRGRSQRGIPSQRGGTHAGPLAIVGGKQPRRASAGAIACGLRGHHDQVAKRKRAAREQQNAHRTPPLMTLANLWWGPVDEKAARRPSVAAVTRLSDNSVRLLAP